MKFIRGVPKFAAEVRSESDYGRAAEADMAAKRTDYFAAGTLVVWDVDPLAETVTVYRASDPTNPSVYRRGDMAEAEPAVPRRPKRVMLSRCGHAPVQVGHAPRRSPS